MDMPTMSDQLRDVIRRSGRSLNSLALESGLPASAVTRFMAGTSITLRTFDRLAATLRLQLIIDSNCRRKPTRKSPSKEGASGIRRPNRKGGRQ